MRTCWSTFKMILCVLGIACAMIHIIHMPCSAAGQEVSDSGNFLDKVIPEWHISGSNTVRTDYYDTRGNEDASPYQYDGLKSYNEFNLNFSKRKSPYDTIKGEVSGVFNGSPYRSNDYGIVPERLNITKEKGDTGMPYRLEMGDIFSYFTYRTLQTSLKGMQLDLQPAAGEKRRHSFLLVSGAQQSSWRDFHPDDSYFNGFSYLLDDKVFGKYTFNFVNNTRQGNEQENTEWRSQFVYSLAGSNTISLAEQKLLFEGEVSFFKGDHNGLTNAESGQDLKDKGLFFQASGRSKLPLTYRLRYEEYGADYQPVGATITSATRNMEGHLGWQFPKGFQARGRIQKIRDSLESDNPTDSVTYGLNITGPIGSLDTFLQNANDKNNQTDSSTSNVSLNINVPRIAGWNSRLGFLYQSMYNRLPDTTDTETKQLTFSADHAVDIFGFTGTVTPGFVLRRIDSYTNKEFDFTPTFAFLLKKNNHSLDYSLSLADQRRLTTGGVDVATTTQNLSYKFTKDRNIVGVEFSSGYRVPEPGRSTDYYKMGAFWTYYFEKPPRAVAARMAPAISPQITAPSPLNIDILAMNPGLNIEDAVGMLRKMNIVDPVKEPGLMVYETRIFEEIEGRQRLALVYQGNTLRKTAFIVNRDVTGRPENVIQTLERIRSVLLDKYGSPSTFYDRGTTGPNLLDNIRTGRFVRIFEWNKPDGILRLGIPRRLDGQIRIELQYAESFPPPGETLWSLEEVR